ncbi:MAG: hypothetical protein WAM05_15640 [Candidatus Binataceae bacterium]
MANFAIPIEPEQNTSGAVSFLIRRIVEESGQTAPYGTPVNVNGTDGGLQAWAGSASANTLAGFLQEGCGFSNLGTTGAGAPQGFTPVLGPGSVIGNYAANPNEPLAVITPSLVPINDGRAGFYVASPTMVFCGKLGTSATVTPVATTNQIVGVQYGLTKDTGNPYWYVDTDKTGGSVAVEIVGLDPRDPVGTVGGRVLFVVLPAVVQITA